MRMSLRTFKVTCRHLDYDRWIGLTPAMRMTTTFVTRAHHRALLRQNRGLVATVAGDEERSRNDNEQGCRCSTPKSTDPPLRRTPIATARRAAARLIAHACPRCGALPSAPHSPGHR